MAYLPLSTANLPDPAIDPAQGSSPQDYFDVDTYTGNGTSLERSALQFQPDLVWIKSRSNAYNNVLNDSVRGVSKWLISDSTDSEQNFAGYGVTSFDNDGFTVGLGTSFNGSGATYVAWNWKANGSGVSNTDGSIPSTVSANTESGFSIVSYTGTGSDVLIGHGLDQKPQMIITKNRDGAYSWTVTHFQMNGGSAPADNGRMYLNSTGAYGVGSGLYDYAEFTDTVYSINGGDHNLNYSGEDYIAYVFHSVEGFSKFGSYTGNGSADGPFVYTGFRPAFVMVKRTDSTGHWVIRDNTRNTINPVGRWLLANDSGAEYDYDSLDLEDFTSNGFKLRTTSGQMNASGGTYIYMAFAENPFKYSNAR
jgi:hypothetical protein